MNRARITSSKVVDEPYEFAVIIREDGQKGMYGVVAEERFLADNALRKIPVITDPEVFDATDLLNRVGAVTGTLSDAVREEQYDEKVIEKFAADLFDGLFRGVVLKELKRAQSRALGARKPLRIRLQLPDSLLVLPWELMLRRDVEPDLYVCQDRSMTLVRSTGDLQEFRPLEIRLPMRVLVVVSTPLNEPPLNAREEIDSILQSLKDLINRGDVQVQFISGSDTLRRMQEAVRSTDFNILHFIGHGTEEAGQIRISLETDCRIAQRLSPEDLWRQLQPVLSIGLVVLNICMGAADKVAARIASVGGAFLRLGVPAVIAHQADISYSAAAQFGGKLYMQLANLESLDWAVARAREGLPGVEWHTPVLYLNYVSGRLFAVPLATQPPRQDRSLLLEYAREAASQRRWCEAASYQREASLTQPENVEIDDLVKHYLDQELMDTCLHEARLACFPGALIWYQKFLGHSAARERPEWRAVNHLVEMVRAVESARVGARDPWLKWRR